MLQASLELGSGKIYISNPDSPGEFKELGIVTGFKVQTNTAEIEYLIEPIDPEFVAKLEEKPPAPTITRKAVLEIRKLKKECNGVPIRNSKLAHYR